MNDDLVLDPTWLVHRRVVLGLPLRTLARLCGIGWQKLRRAEMGPGFVTVASLARQGMTGQARVRRLAGILETEYGKLVGTEREVQLRRKAMKARAMSAEDIVAYSMSRIRGGMKWGGMERKGR